MTIEKRSSGKWRVKQMVDGKTYYANFDYKPSKKEAEEVMRKIITERSEKINGSMTMKEAAQKYISMKSNILSPSTITIYGRMARNLPEWFSSLPIDEVNQVAINKFVNEKAADSSPKTVRNYHGFISAILGTFRPSMHIYTTLPQKRKIEPYTPSDGDVRNLLSALEGSPYYIGVFLACMGLRRSEVMALTPEDVSPDGRVVINKAAVYSPGGGMVVKSTKTTESEREIFIPTSIAEMIHEKGCVYDGNANQLSEIVSKTAEEIGIPRFTLHKLRHYFASKMLTITDSKTVQALGGWKTDAVMKSVYAHSMKDEQERAKRLAADKLSKSIF